MILKELRIKSGLTQKKLAVKLGVSSQTILNWENGIFEPKIKQLIALADMFNVPLDQLLGRKRKTNEIEEICKALSKISKESYIDFIKKYLQDY